MDFTCIIFGFIFTIGGLIFALGKIHIYLAVWKNMPGEEKNKINIKVLVRNIGEIITLCGIIFLLKGFIADIEDKWFIGAMIAWLIVAGFDVWHISKSSRYQNK